MGDTVEVRIDREECIMCAACWAVCPEVFEEDPGDGLSAIAAQYRSEGSLGAGRVPAEYEDCAREAAQGCPVEIIHVR